MVAATAKWVSRKANQFAVAVTNRSTLSLNEMGSVEMRSDEVT